KAYRRSQSRRPQRRNLLPPALQRGVRFSGSLAKALPLRYRTAQGCNLARLFALNSLLIAANSICYLRFCNVGLRYRLNCRRIAALQQATSFVPAPPAIYGQSAEGVAW